MATITPAFLAMQGDDTKWLETGFLDLSSIPNDLVTALGGYLENDKVSYPLLPGSAEWLAWEMNQKGLEVPAGLPPPPVYTDGKRGLQDTELQKKHFAPVRSYKCKADRPYPPTGSSVGPYVSGRVAFSEFFIERNCDKLSPIIMEYCCTARVFPLIHLAFWLNEPRRSDTEQLVHIEIGGSAISDYEILGDLTSGQRFTPQPLNLQTATSLNQVAFFSGARRREQFSLWFTTIRLQVLGVQRFWDAGSDSAFEAPDDDDDGA